MTFNLGGRLEEWRSLPEEGKCRRRRKGRNAGEKGRRPGTTNGIYSKEKIKRGHALHVPGKGRGKVIETTGRLSG